MILGGLIKNSLIDYPGTVSCVVFTKGCNFHCPYCHNPDLVPMGTKGEAGISADSVFEFLEKRKGLLDGVVVTGGEPTLQKGLVDFIRRVKSLGFRVKLDTNGSRPQVLRGLLGERLLDDVAMDIKTRPDSYAPLIWDRINAADIIMECIDVIRGSGIGYEFRTTCVRPFVDEMTFPGILSAIHGAGRYVLQRFKPSRTLSPEFGRHESPGLSEIALQKMKEMADACVRECVIR